MWWLFLHACLGEPERAKVDSDSAAALSDSDTGPGVTDPDGDGDGVPGSADCDDADPAIHPEAEERCDSIDNNCDGAVDDQFGEVAEPLVGPLIFEGTPGSFGSAVQAVPDLDQDFVSEWLVADPELAEISVFEVVFEAQTVRSSETQLLVGVSASRAGETLVDLGWTNSLFEQRRVAIGAPQNNGGEGAVYVLEAFDGFTIDLTVDAFAVTGSDPLAALGTAFAGPADFNGDGTGDLVVSAPGSGVIYVDYDTGFTSSAADIARQVDVGAQHECGAALAAGDHYNDNGYPWLAIGCPGYDERDGDEGAVWVFSGGSLLSAPYVVDLVQIDAVRISSAEAGAAFGSTMVQNPGGSAADLVVGAPGADGGAGRVYSIDLSGVRAAGMPSSLLLSDAVYRWDGPADSAFGGAVDGNVDVDRDGLGELVSASGGSPCPAGLVWLLPGAGADARSLPGGGARSFATGDPDFGASVGIWMDPWSDTTALIGAAPSAGKVYVFSPG